MPALTQSQMTEALRRLRAGDQDAFHIVMPLAYEELKKLARAHLRREVDARSPQATVLVHEAYLRMAGGGHPVYENRAHFYGIASRLMRQVLVDSARARSAVKRGAALEVPLSELSDWESSPDRSVLAL